MILPLIISGLFVVVEEFVFMVIVFEVRMLYDFMVLNKIL